MVSKTKTISTGEHSFNCTSIYTGKKNQKAKSQLRKLSAVWNKDPLVRFVMLYIFLLDLFTVALHYLEFCMFLVIILTVPQY